MKNACGNKSRFYWCSSCSIKTLGLALNVEKPRYFDIVKSSPHHDSDLFNNKILILMNEIVNDAPENHLENYDVCLIIKTLPNKQNWWFMFPSFYHPLCGEQRQTPYRGHLRILAQKNQFCLRKMLPVLRKQFCTYISVPKETNITTIDSIRPQSIYSDGLDTFVACPTKNFYTAISWPTTVGKMLSGRAK